MMNEQGYTQPAIFREMQRFRQWWLWLLIILIPGVAWYGAIRQLVFKKPFGDNPAPDSLMFIIWIIFGIGFPIFFYSVRLVTEVRFDGLYFRFFPFHRSFHKIAFDELKTYETRSYNAFREYGGYGIHFGVKGKAYNVSGNRGVQLELVNGKRILFGSQKPDEFVRALDSAMGK